MESIRDNVTKEELLEAMPGVYSAWRERDPSASRPRQPRSIITGEPTTS